MEIYKEEIQKQISDITIGSRPRMKAVLEAIEILFENISLIAIDTKKDTVIFGADYLDEQERLMEGEDDK